MAKGNLAACLRFTLKFEGKYSNNRKDPGNWTGGKVGVGVLKGTNMGIAAHSFPHLDIKNLTEADVIPIYRDKYWNEVAGEALPFGLDLVAFDYGVNSGPSRGVKALQAEIGAKVDGKPGSETILKAASADIKRAIQGVCRRRLSFYRVLPTWETFKRGWSARIAAAEAQAVSMWLARGGVASETDKRVLKDEADKAGKVSSTQQKGASGTVTGGAGIGAGDAAMTGDINWLLVGGIAVAVIVVAGILIVKARQNRERAEAYRSVAAA